MAKYRKRPIIVEAEQWFPGIEIEGVWEIPAKDGIPAFGQIGTLEGRGIVMSGDWVITGIKGEKYPCKADIFEMTYEPVEK